MRDERTRTGDRRPRLSTHIRDGRRERQIPHIKVTSRRLRIKPLMQVTGVECEKDTHKRGQGE